jgi:outer membrane protein OmpA-like peptidoglycan-associated protein
MLNNVKNVAVVLALALLALPGRAWAADGDGDGLDDAWEKAYFGSLVQDGQGDPDGDGLSNLEELQAGTNPMAEDTDHDGLSDKLELDQVNLFWASDATRPDTDGDFLLDGEEVSLWGTSPNRADSDLDGLNDYAEVKLFFTDPNSRDTDNGFSDDGREVLADRTDPLDPADDHQDSDGDGLWDYQEVTVYLTNRLLADTDGDGLSDKDEVDLGTDPRDPDTDRDGLLDGQEQNYLSTDPLKPDTDGDTLLDGDETDLYLTDPLLPDSDWDTLDDGYEVLAGMDPLNPDTDGGGVLDPVEVWQGLNPFLAADDVGLDADGDGLTAQYETAVSGTDPDNPDTDGDDLDDGQDHFPLDDRQATDPLDADTDDDGLLDGHETGYPTPLGIVGGTLATRFDTDLDGLSDGVESGLAGPEVSPLDPDATDPAKFVSDADPGSNTSPLAGDTDADGLSDGEEDRNHNGRWDSVLGDAYWPDGETNPFALDTDGDGMDDAWEVSYADPGQGTGAPLNPLTPADKATDPDGDGLSNLKEYLVVKVVAGKQVPNRTNPRQADSDDDGLGDAVEVYSYYGAGMRTDPNLDDSDLDGLPDGVEDSNQSGRLDAGETNPMVADSDADNLTDGAEDADHDGAVDAGETDPRKWDSDGDGLGDGEELVVYGSDPLALDSDGDGLPDGREVGRAGDADPASRTSPTRADSDGDGLSDGVEDANQNGRLDPGETDPNAYDTDGDGLPDGLERGVAGDADPASTTDPLKADTDGDLLTDGMEDADHDGQVGPGETDPNAADSDGGGVPDGVEVYLDHTNPLDPTDDATADPDGDGLVNAAEWGLGTAWRDPDTDHDSIPDGVEVGNDPAKPLDADGDGSIDALEQDSDADGIPDAVEAGDADPLTAPADSDSDELPDYRDPDSDADGLPDALEWTVDADLDGQADPDADGDGVFNYRDSDSDEDGKPDVDEGAGDVDGDGIPNWVDPDDATPPVEAEGEEAPEVGEAEPAEPLEEVLQEPLTEMVSEEGPEAEAVAEVEAMAEGSSEAEGASETVTESTTEADAAGETTSETLAESAAEVIDEVGEPDAGEESTSEVRGKLQGGVTCSAAGMGAADRPGWAAWALLLAVLGLLGLARRAGQGAVPRAGVVLLALGLALIPGGRTALAADGPADLTTRPCSLRGAGDSIVGTWTGRTLGRMQTLAGLTLGYTGASLTEVDQGQTLRTWLGDRWEAEVFGTFGVLSFLDLGFAVPIVMHQAYSRSGDGGRAGGLGDLLVAPAVQILRQDGAKGVNLGVSAELSVPTGDPDAFMSPGVLQLATRVALSRSRGPFTLAGNAWYRFAARRVEVLNIKDGDQVGLSAGLGVQLKRLPLRAGLDLYLAVPAREPFFHKEAIFSEAALAVGYQWGSFLVRVGGAAGLAPGYGVPQERVFVTLAWATRTARFGVDEAAPSAPVAEAAPPAPVAPVAAVDPDPDHDGLAGPADQCSDAPEDLDGYQDDDGCPDRDNDGDTVVDEADGCPDQAGPVERKGCPEGSEAKAPAAPLALEVVRKPPKAPAEEVLADKVLFSRASARLDPAYVPMLERLVIWLKDHPEVREVTVEGHSSLTGPVSINQRLSQTRAEAVRMWLIQAGIAAGRVQARGFGAARPILPDSSDQANTVNQRVEFRVSR